MGQITATRNLVATKVVRLAGQWNKTFGYIISHWLFDFSYVHKCISTAFYCAVFVLPIYVLSMLVSTIIVKNYENKDDRSIQSISDWNWKQNREIWTIGAAGVRRIWVSKVDHVAIDLNSEAGPCMLCMFASLWRRGWRVDFRREKTVLSVTVGDLVE